MAEALGKRLRDEIHVEDLGSLLASIRLQHNVAPQPLHIPVLDDLLSPILNPPPPPPPNLFRDGSPAFDNGRRGTAERSTTRPTASNRFSKPYPVVEIISQRPRAGRTQLVHLAAAHALLGDDPGPSSSAHDAGNAVVWVDIDRRLDIQRMHTILVSILRSRRERRAANRAACEEPSEANKDDNDNDSNHNGDDENDNNYNGDGDNDSNRNGDNDNDDNYDNMTPKPSPPSTSSQHSAASLARHAASAAARDHSLATAALDHLHVFRPTSFAALLATVRSLPSAMIDGAVLDGAIDEHNHNREPQQQQHLSGARPVAFVLLSGVTSLYWAERARVEAPAFSSTMGVGVDAETKTDVAAVAAQTLLSTQTLGLPQTQTQSHNHAQTQAATQAATQAPTHHPSRPQSITDRYASLTSLLAQAQRQLHCGVVLTRWAGPGAPRLGPGWDAAVDVRLMLRREERVRLPGGISVREALEGRRREEGGEGEEGRDRGVRGAKGVRGEGEEGGGRERGRDSRFAGVVLVDGRERGRFAFKVGAREVVVWEGALEDG